MDAMWLGVLRGILLSWFFLFACAGAFLAGIFVARSTARDNVALELPSVPPELRRRARELAEEALAARSTGDTEAALRLYDEASVADPGLRGLHYQRGLAHLAAGRYAEAEAAALASLAAKEQVANANALLVMCAAGFSRAGRATDPGKVAEWAANGHSADPLNPFVHYAQGEFLRSTGHAREAVEHYRRALERVSATDSFLVAATKAGLSGIRLEQYPEDKGFASRQDAAALSPEDHLFAAARALVARDTAAAKVHLSRAREVLKPEVFSAVLKDSFFQDYLPEGMFADPQ